MKNVQIIFALLAVVLFSCGNKQQEQSFVDASFAENYNQTLQATSVNYQKNDPITGKQTINAGGKKKLFVIKDPSNGMTYGTMPIPQSWRPTPNSKETYLEGPNGIKIYNDASNFFHYSNDPGFNQFMQQSGNQVRPIMSMDAFFIKEIKPLAEKEGGRLVNKYPIKQMADLDSRIDMMFMKTMQENKMFSAMVTEWENDKGIKSVVLIKHNVANYGTGNQSWGFTISAMEAPIAVYNQAKEDFINALLNVRVNPQYVQAVNQKNQQQARQSNAGHNARMANIKAFGDNNTRNFNARSAASDAQYASWRSGQAASDNMHTRTINSINEVSTYQDGSGTNYQVDGYYNNVYSNGNGDYIGTDDPNYNPNIQQNGNWEQLESTDDGWN